MAFLHVNLLDHLVIFFDMLMISHLDIIPFKDTIYKAFEKNKDDIIPISLNFEIFGFSSSFAFINLCDTFLLYLTVAAVWVAYKILSIFLAKIKTKRMQNIQKSINETLEEYKYNAIVRTFIESYLDLIMWALLNVRYFYVDDIFNISSGIFSIIIFVIIFYLSYRFVLLD